MIGRIVSINPENPGGFAPLLSGISLIKSGTPLLIGYELSGVACGVLAADCFEDFMILRWICVDSSCRRRGIGGQLLDSLCEIAADVGVRKIDAVTCSFSSEEAVGIEALLTLRGFTSVEDTPVYSFPLSVILNGSLAPFISRKNDHIVSIQTLPGHLQRELKRLCAKRGGPQLLGRGFGDLLPESVVWLENGIFFGCALLAPCGDGIELRWFHAKDAKTVQGLLTNMVRKVSANYPPNTVIHVSALTSSVDKLIQKLAGEQLTEHAPVVQYSLELNREG